MLADARKGDAEEIDWNELGKAELPNHLRFGIPLAFTADPQEFWESCSQVFENLQTKSKQAMGKEHPKDKATTLMANGAHIHTPNPDQGTYQLRGNFNARQLICAERATSPMILINTPAPCD